MKTLKKICTLISLLGACLALAGCDSDFYLSESEVAAYSENLRTETSINELLAPVANQLFEINFVQNGSSPQIHDTNLLALTRSTRLSLLEPSHQLRLDRWTTQIEEQLDRWIASRLNILEERGGSRLRMEQYRRIAVRFLSAPTFHYDAQQQTISFEATLRLTFQGRLDVRVVEGFSGFIASLLGENPNGQYDLSVTVNDYRVTGRARLASPFVNAARAQLHVEPQSVQAANIEVLGVPQSIRNGMSEVLAQELSAPIDEAYDFNYRHFALNGLRLTDRGVLEVNYQSQPDRPDPILDMVARSEGGDLYHLRRRAPGSSEQRKVQLGVRTFNGDPVLISSGPDLLELAAISSAGEFVYANWREGQWTNQFYSTPGGYRPGKPAAVATAPGQLEVFAVGADGLLRHLRRIDGIWRAPVVINAPQTTPPYKNPIAVQVNDKIALLYIDGSNHLRLSLLDVSTLEWAPPIDVAARVSEFAPAAAACGDATIDVAYVNGTERAPRHRRYQLYNVASRPLGVQLSASAETSLGGVLTSSPAIACSGFRQLELVGRNAENRLVHNHYVGPDSVQGQRFGRLIQQGWQGWEDASERFFGDATVSTQMLGPAIGYSANGETYLAALQQPRVLNLLVASFNFEPNIFVNSYDASRYGRAPWKTVGWRGLQKISDLKFSGTPAIAVTPRSIIAAVAGANSNVWTGNINLDRAGGFSQISNPQSTGSPGENLRIVVSSGPGIVDVLTGGGLFLDHLRQLNSNTIVDRSFEAIPRRTALRDFTAIVSANELIEVIAVDNTGAVHHSRYLNRSWLRKQTLTGRVSSSPVLVSTGAGRLQLFAVSTDHHLQRWRYGNGQWSGPETITPLLLNAGLFGSRCVSLQADGKLDLALVQDGTNKVYHLRLSPNGTYAGGPQTFVRGGNLDGFLVEVGGNVTDVPTLIALSPVRVTILVPGTDGIVYSNWLTTRMTSPADLRPSISRPDTRPTDLQFYWEGYRPVSQPNLRVGGIVRLATNEMTALGTDEQGKILVNNYSGWRWTGFHPLHGQSLDTQSRASNFRPRIFTTP